MTFIWLAHLALIKLSSKEIIAIGPFLGFILPSWKQFPLFFCFCFGGGGARSFHLLEETT